MKPEKMKTVGLVDMHPMQVKHLMELVGMTLNLAANTGDDEIMDDAEHLCDEMVKLFGGVGVTMTVEDDPDVTHDGSQSVH